MSPFIKQAATLIKLVLCSGSVPGPLDNLAGRKAHPGLLDIVHCGPASMTVKHVGRGIGARVLPGKAAKS